MTSPRYLAEHLIMPGFLRERGAAAVLDAIERSDSDFFIPVWMQAGFRFSPRFMYRTTGELRIGAMTLPRPREATEAYFAAVVGKPADAAFARYFLLEASDSAADGATRTIVGEWAASAHRNYGAGPPFTGDLATDCGSFLAQVATLCS